MQPPTPEEPAIAEKEQETDGKCDRYFPSCDLLAAHAARTQAREGEENEAEKFGVERGVEQSRVPLKVIQYLIHDTEIPAGAGYSFITKPVNIDNGEKHAQGAHELNHFGQPPQIVFALHKISFGQIYCPETVIERPVSHRHPQAFHITCN